jgi:hypothetical protein
MAPPTADRTEVIAPQTLHERTLEARERVLGPDHLDTVKSRGYLAEARAAADAAKRLLIE